MVHAFKTALDRMVSNEYKVGMRADKRPAGEHGHRFNASQVNEIAVVTVGKSQKQAYDFITDHVNRGIDGVIYLDMHQELAKRNS
ncbi:hypothetical protein CEXT_606141 [Caerostris extrusa]|uniref:Uncharacterized protein n=1 Tax=Caerostris extrusa TaxID=172846 RepID=A0AAV4SDJ0_CAEEX|nr:hypothetical protein CEXT_606141 [Caerostris extrusa]